MKRILFTLLLGFAGYAAVRAWLPRYDGIATGSPLKIGREDAIQLAVKVAAAKGVDTTGWRFGVSVNNRQRTAAARAMGSTALLQRFPLALIEVGGYHSDTRSSLRAVLTEDGRLFSWRLHDGRVRQLRDDHDDPKLAEAEFRTMTGDLAGRFEKAVAGARSQDGFRTVWEYPDPERPGVLARFTVVIRSGKVVQSENQLEVGEQALSPEQQESQARFLKALPYITAFAWLLIVLTLWAFFSSFLRRFDHLKMAYAAAWLGLPFLLASLLGGGGVDDLALALSENPGAAASSRLLLLLAEFIPVAVFAILLSAGYAILPNSEKPRWIGIKLVSEGRLAARAVGQEIAAGLLFGAAMAAALLLPARLGLTAINSVNLAAVLMLDRLPLLRTLNVATQWTAMVPLAIVVPWCCSRRRGSRWLLALGLILSGTMWLSMGSVSRFNWNASVLATVSLFALSLVCYRMWGLLAAAVAPAGALTLYLCFLLMAMPSQALQSQGWTAWLVWIALLGTASVFGWRGVEVPQREVIESMDPPPASISRSERERLRADLEVARRAQQDMLPSHAPSLDGYTIAGSCYPALEVGGDLFDYLAFPSGEFGLCVADVSGKGVSASLYMTMTKGMLMAAREEPADLSLILSRLNRHLKAWGRKRTFVTMSLAMLHPETGKLRHARAGHNPPVLLRGGKAQFLQPAGLGLGLAGPASFDRILQVEEIELDPGDCLVLYSDGLTECMNRRQELYGEERLLRVIEQSAGLPAREVEETVLRDVREFQGEAEAHDDLTIVVLRRELAATPAIA